MEIYTSKDNEQLTMDIFELTGFSGLVGLE